MEASAVSNASNEAAVDDDDDDIGKTEWRDFDDRVDDESFFVEEEREEDEDGRLDAIVSSFCLVLEEDLPVDFSVEGSRNDSRSNSSADVGIISRPRTSRSISFLACTNFSMVSSNSSWMD